MRPHARAILKLTTGFAASLLGLAACGRFETLSASPGVLQIASRPSDANQTVPSGSIEQMQRNEDPITQSEDPVLQQLKLDQKMPANTFDMIRVRLFPMLSSFPGDPFLNSENINTISLQNDGGLTIQSLLPSAPFKLTGHQASFQFAKQVMIIDGHSYPLQTNSEVGIFPTAENSLTEVSLRIDSDRLRKAQVPLVKNTALSFRGDFLVKRLNPSTKSSAGLRWSVINYVDLESYIQSVVPSEVSSKFEAEALKAQALASRTFALRSMAVARCTGLPQTACQYREWDVDPSTAYQSFVGVLSEKTSIAATIEQTKDKLISFKGAPILAMFYASSGGETTGAKEYFCKALSAVKLDVCGQKYGAQYPYLIEQKDPYNGDFKRFGHGVGLPQQSAEAMAKQGKTAEQIIAQYYPGSAIERFDSKSP
jgi:hypothetical protein